MFDGIVTASIFYGMVLVEKDLHFWVGIRLLAELGMVFLALEKFQQCSLYSPLSAEISLSEDFRVPQWSRLHLSAAAVKAARDHLISFSFMGDVMMEGISLGAGSSLQVPT